MSRIREWFTIAASNAAASPNGYPELMARSGVNDSDRETLASLKRWYDNPVALRPFEGFVFARSSGTQFTLVDGAIETNAKTRMLVNQYVRMIGVGVDAGKTWIGFITSSPAGPDYSDPTTTFHIAWRSDLSFDTTGPTTVPDYIEVAGKEYGTATWRNTGTTDEDLVLVKDLDDHVFTLEASLDVGLLDGSTRENMMMDAARARMNANGAALIWQRGTIFDAGTEYANDDGNVCADNWTIASDGDDRVDVSRSTDVPAGEAFPYSMRLAAATVPGNQKHGVMTFVEVSDGYDVAVAGTSRRVSAGFWAKFDAAATGIDQIRVYLLNLKTAAPSLDPVTAWSSGFSGSDVAFEPTQWEKVASAQVTLTSAWQYFTPAALLNVDMDIASAGSGAFALFFHVDESTIASGAAWFLTGSQVNRGAEALPYILSPVALEIVRCQRYFESTFDEFVRPGHNKGNAHALAAISSGALVVADWRFAVAKYYAPTLVTYNPSVAVPATGNWYDGTVERVVSSSDGNQQGQRIFCTTATDATVHRIAAAAHANIWGAN